MNIYKKGPDGLYRIVRPNEWKFYKTWQEYEKFFSKGHIEQRLHNGDRLILKEPDGEILTGYIHLYEPHAAQGSGYFGMFSFTFLTQEGEWRTYFNVGGAALQEHVPDLLEIEKEPDNINWVYRTGDIVEYAGKQWTVELQIENVLLLAHKKSRGITTNHEHERVDYRKVMPISLTKEAAVC